MAFSNYTFNYIKYGSLLTLVFLKVFLLSFEKKNCATVALSLHLTAVPMYILNKGYLGFEVTKGPEAISL